MLKDNILHRYSNEKCSDFSYQTWIWLLWVLWNSMHFHQLSLK